MLLMVLSCAIIIPTPAGATAYAIPINGRFATSKIALRIPSTPKWAHDVVLNASLAWNNGQLWFQHTYFPDGSVYKFIESNKANATITYAIPPMCGDLAVGWTDYAFSPSSPIIVSTRTYLDPAVFNVTQGPNATANQYAFRLALHELGRVLGLGNVINGNDIMDPLATPDHATQPPMLSTLDLFAVHVLASENTLTSMVVVLDTDQYQLLNAWSFLKSSSGFVSSLSANGPATLHSHRILPTVNETSSIGYKLGSVDRFVSQIGFLTLFMIDALAFASLSIMMFGSRRKGDRAN